MIDKLTFLQQTTKNITGEYEQREFMNANMLVLKQLLTIIMDRVDALRNKLSVSKYHKY
jgi:hypothetical protein